MRLGHRRRRRRKETTFTKLAKYPYLNLQSFIYLCCSFSRTQKSSGWRGAIKSYFPDGTDFYYCIGMWRFYFDSQRDYSAWMDGWKGNIDWNRKHFTSVCILQRTRRRFYAPKICFPIIGGRHQLKAQSRLTFKHWVCEASVSVWGTQKFSVPPKTKCRAFNDANVNSR